MPLEHIHPIIVHFPIVFVVTLFALDLFAALRGRAATGKGDAFTTTSTVNAVGAGAFALLAMAVGDVAAEIAEGKGLSATVAQFLETHEALGSATAILIAVWAFIRGWFWYKDRRVSGAGAWALVGVDAAILALVVATAWFGGNLVYEYGVNVAALQN